MVPNSYLEKVKQLDDPQLQQGFMVFASDPNNEGSVQELADAPFSEWTRSIDTTYQGLAHVAKNGPPAGMIEGLQQQSQTNQDPSKRKAAGEMVQTLSSPEFQQAALEKLERAKQQGFEEKPEMLNKIPSPRGFRNGGLADQGRMGDRYTAHVARGEMVVPNIVLDRNPGLRQGIGAAMLRTGADPARFTMGSGKEQINPETGRAEYFIGAIIGGIIGGAIGATSFATAAAMVGIGAAAGNFIETGDIGSSIMWGLGGWGLGSLAASSGYLGAAGWDLAGNAAAMSGMGGAQNIYVANEAMVGAGGTPIAAGETFTASGLESLGFDAADVGFTSISAPVAVTDASGAASLMQAGSPTVTPQIGADSIVNPPVVTGGGGGVSTGVSFFDDPIAWAGENKAQAALGALSVAGAMGTMDAPQPERPAGYDPNDPQQQLGYYDFENIPPQPGDISTLAPGAPGTAGNPIPTPYTGPAVSTAGGYSYAPTISYGAYRPPAGAATLGPYATAWPTMPSYTALVASGGHIRGPGSEKSDSIPARLSDGEFVMTTKAVRGAGKGNLREGARRMYAMMDELERRA